MRTRKVKTLLSIFTLTSLLLVSCSESTTNVGSSGSTSNTGGDSGGDVSSGDGSSGDSGTGSTGGGSSSGGSLPIYYQTILVAGQGTGLGDNKNENNTWKPWGNSDNLSDLGKSLMPKIVEAKSYFRADSKLDIRFKLYEQPNPGGVEYCYGRKTEGAKMSNYTQVKFKVSLRDITCSESGDSNNCTLGEKYNTQTVGPVQVNSYSEVLHLGHLRNDSDHGTTVEVHDVMTDTFCQDSDTYCPTGQYLRLSDCWEARMEISTDYTESF